VSPPDDDDSARPRSITVAVALVGLEALALVCFAVTLLFHIDGDTVGLGVANVVFFVVYALGLGFAAWGLNRLSTWSRSPIVLAQVIQLGVAWSFYGSDTAWLAVLLAGVAVVVLAIAIAPATTKALYGERESDIT
jgi:hypothetical protein